MAKRNLKRQAILNAANRLFRAQGFDKTSMSEITAEVGGSKATIYSYFPSKEELFVECMLAAAEDYITNTAAQTVAQMDAAQADPGAALREFGAAFLRFTCSADMLAVRRLLIAEATRSDIGKMFFAKITALRAHVAALLSRLTSSGLLHADDPQLAAEHLRALLEAEILEPLLLHARADLPDETEIAWATERAVAAFLRAYPPGGSITPTGS